MREEIKKWITDKALSIVFTLLSTLAISVGGHLFGVKKLTDTQKDRDVYKNRVDSLKANCKH
jgi:hypothetical protein